MSFIHDWRYYTDIDYRIQTSAQQAIIDEIRKLRQAIEAKNDDPYQIKRVIAETEQWLAENPER